MLYSFFLGYSRDLEFCADVSVHCVCSICCTLSFGWFPGIWNLCADVSVHCLFHLVFFLLGDSPASEFYVPTFRNTLSLPYVVFFLLDGSPAAEFYVPTFRNTLSLPSVVFFLLDGSPASEFYVPTFRNTVSSICCILFWMVPRHLNFSADVSEHSLPSVVLFPLGDSPTSEFYVPTFRYTVPSSWALKAAYTTYEDGTECSETSEPKIQTLRNRPKESIKNLFLRKRHIVREVWYSDCEGYFFWVVA
jgi:hypothetical protein